MAFCGSGSGLIPSTSALFAPNYSFKRTAAKGCVTIMVFPVTEIDKWGGAWVELEVPVDANHFQSHSLSLAANEMELVSSPVEGGT